MKLSGFLSALLVENDRNGEVKIIKIEFDENEFEKRIHLGLVDFVNKYRNMSENDFFKLISKYYK